MRASLLAVAALALAACAGQPDFFLLPSPQPVAQRASPVGSIAVAEISLPAYADAMEIAVLVDPAPQPRTARRSGPTRRGVP